MSDNFYPRDGEWESLEQALWRHTVDELKTLATALPGPAPAGHKAQRIEQMCQRMTGDSLHDLWSRLDELQQAAVAMAVHSPDASFNPLGFKIRYGNTPDFGEKGWAHGLKKPTLLCMFIHGRHVPLDLRERLLEIVTPLAVPDVPLVNEIPAKLKTSVPPHSAGNPKSTGVKRWLPVYRSDGERRALAELVDVLRLVGAEQIGVTPKTLEIDAKSRRLIAKVLEGGDFLNEDRWKTSKSDPPPRAEDLPIRSIAWPRLLSQAGLIRARSGRVRLTTAGRKAMSAPRPAVLQDVWTSWQKGSDFDELYRISEVKGLGSSQVELSDLPLRRNAIARALAQCPPREWVEADALFDHVRAAGHDFPITWRPDLLYFDEYFEKIPLDCLGEEDMWMILQGRYILCVLFEVMATLGMIDVAYTSPVHARRWSDYGEQDFVSRYDGLRYVRLTGLGLYCLGLATSYEAEALDVRGALRVSRNLEIKASGGKLSPSDVIVLEAYTGEASGGVWRLERPRLLKAVEDGQSLEFLRSFLEKQSATPLPQAVEDLLNDCEVRAHSLKLLGAGCILECPDAKVAKRVATDRRTGRHCMLAGERCLVVPEASIRSFRRALRQLGYGWPS